MSPCFIKQRNKGAYFGVEVYINVFLTTALDRDMPLNSKSDYYLATKETLVLTVYEALREGENGGSGKEKDLRHIYG